MLTGGAPLQLSSLYRTQLTFSRSQTAVGEGQTSWFSFCGTRIRALSKWRSIKSLNKELTSSFL